MIDCFVDERSEELEEIVFVHRFAFEVHANEAAIHGTNFTTAYAFRSVTWGFKVNTDRAEPEIELRSSISRFEEPHPHGSCSLRYETTSKNYDDVGEGLLEAQPFRGSAFLVQRNSEFAKTLFDAIHTQQMDGGYVSVTISLRFLPADFFSVGMNTDRAPPDSIPSTDFRSIAIASNFVNQKDFKIIGTNGELMVSKYLLYLSCCRFHDLLEEDPKVTSALVPFEYELLDQVIGFAMKGTISLPSKSVDKVRQFLDCVQYVRPLMRQQLLAYIRVLLTQMVVQEWKTSNLDYIVKMLDIAYEYRFISLFDVAMNLIADQHYVEFRRQYNEHSEGENGLIYRRLSFSAMGPFFAPVRMVTNVARKSASSLRFLRWADGGSQRRLFVE